MQKKNYLSTNSESISHYTVHTLYYIISSSFELDLFFFFFFYLAHIQREKK